MVWTVLVQLAWAAFFAVVSYALTPGPPDATPASLEDFKRPTIEEGRPIPVLFGRKRRMQSPVVTFWGDIGKVAVKSSSK